MQGSRAATILPAMAWALVGVLAAHVVAYRLVHPDGHTHDAALEASGHGWLSLLVPMLLVALGIALVAGRMGSWRGRHRGVRFAVLVSLQVGAYVALEIAERVLAGVDVHVLLHQLRDHGFGLTLLIGCSLQVLTAWLGSAASRLVAGAARRPRSAPRSRPLGWIVVAIVERIPAASRSWAHASRAPPLRGPLVDPST